MILYKFRDWKNEKHRRILQENQLYLSPPSLFNDPFDCRIFPQFIDLTNREVEMYANMLIIENNLDLGEKKFIIEKITKNPQSHQFDFEEIAIKNHDMCSGIISLTGIWSNTLMWSHYANNHKGFCIGFDEEKLIKEYNFTACGFVEYPEDRKHPKISPITDGDLESFKTAIYNKSIDWKYENEYRLTKIMPNGFTVSDRVVSFSDDCIRGITLGLNIDINSEREILEICRERDIIVYKAIKKTILF